jgi:hypothetical protein
MTNEKKQNNMEKFIKTMVTLLVVAFVGYAIFGVVKAGFSNFFVHASFITSALLVLVLTAIVYFAFVGVKEFWKTPLFDITIAAILGGCSYAKSNQQVVISTDCGMTWEKVSAGDAVPTGTGNRCFMKVVMPNYPMQGESKFIANLKDRVRANTHIDYDYSINEPLSFIKQAKYLGKANADVDSEGALNPSEFEGAENMVIDKRIKDVAKGLFLREDIVELDQADLENALLEEANKVLAPLGVTLNFITLTFDLDEQTRQAIDIATAMKIYQSKSLGELGVKVMEARAGATKISIEQKEQENKSED